MSAPLSPERLAEIRADLNAVPAPPWRWIGVRGSGGPQLVTDHSGRQYLLRAKKPTDAAGDEVLDFVTDAPVYGDLEFRDQRPGEQYATMRTGDQMAVGRADYDPDAIVGVDNPVARWMERSAAHAAALLAEVERQAGEIERLKADLEPYEMLAAQQCESGVHADWAVDSENNHPCPWCRITALLAERHETNEALDNAVAAIKAASEAAALVAEYRVPTANGRWLSVRRASASDRWSIVQTFGNAPMSVWAGGRWTPWGLARDEELWAYDSADAALAEATRLAEAGEPR